MFCNWRKAWRNGLSQAERDVIEFIVKDRGDEVHNTGSSRSAATDDIPVYDSYSEPGITMTVAAPPGAPPAVIRKPMYCFAIAGTGQKATEACAKYLTLLNQMVAKFAEDFP
jgi:hypothetical protein